MNANQEKTQERRYTVSFYDGEMLLRRTNVLENKRVEVPEAPAKEGYEFMGWYKDSSKTRGFYYYEPITADTNIYAKYLTYKEVFLEARENTARVNQFKYDYQLDFRILTKHLHPSAYYRGTVQYNEHSRDVKYYKDEIIGGGLKIDRHNYSFLRTGETELNKARYKYKGSLQPMDKEEKPGRDGDYIDTEKKDFSGKEYDYSVFAKSLFKHDDDKIDTVTKIGANKYQVTFKKSVKDKALEFLGKIGMNVVARKLQEHGTDAFKNVVAYVTLNEDKTQIKELYYAFDLRLNFASEESTEEEQEGTEKSKTVKLKGPIDFTVKYKMTFDNAFDGNINMPSKISSIVG